ncbi:KH domain-containing protein [Candidatus Gracilibacteria bacterium]|nr:KH domain-containing protein [Candidatus Gracilibacteria bacterium]MCF7819061.1 KH domain-containing protein [Candidatus Gracilibacteria bacterium]
MSENESVLDFLRYVLEQICDHKSDISLEQTEDSLGTLISIRVNDEDMGKLIGKNGQTISALRLLCRSIGARNGQRVNLKVLEPAS